MACKNIENGSLRVVLIGGSPPTAIFYSSIGHGIYHYRTVHRHEGPRVRGRLSRGLYL